MNKEQKNQCPRCHQATADDLKALIEYANQLQGDIR